MPIFEGLTFSGERNVVIMDIGNAYTKCGITGEFGPGCIIPSRVKSKKTGQVCRLWEYQDKDELYSNLKDFIFVVYFRHLLVNPKDRRVVICESLMCPTTFRETLAKVLFIHFEVSSVMFVPNHLISLLTLGTNTGLVMDVGYTETLVVPVYDGISIMRALQAIPMAGRAIHRRIKENLVHSSVYITSKGEEKSVSEIRDRLTDDVLEDIKVRCCFVTNISRGKLIHDVLFKGVDTNKLPPPPPDVQYPLDGNIKVQIKGSVREHSCEVLFEQDSEQISIATLLLDALLKCPIDTRKDLASNILITGGTAMLPGFYHRLKCELHDLLNSNKYKEELAVKNFRFHQPPSKENYTAWLGAAVFGSLETLPMKSLSRDQYLKTRKLPDWCCLDSDIDSVVESKEHSVEKKFRTEEKSPSPMKTAVKE